MRVLMSVFNGGQGGLPFEGNLKMNFRLTPGWALGDITRTPEGVGTIQYRHRSNWAQGKRLRAKE